MNNRKGSEDGAGRSQFATDGGYRWQCPICGTARVNTMSERGRNALRALRRHVYRSEGEGHGEKGAYPDDLPVDELRRHVRPIDDR